MACTKVHGCKSFDVDESNAKPTNPNGVDEIKVARVVGANGLRPYLSKNGKHRRAHVDGGGGLVVMRPLPHRLLDEGDAPIDNNVPFAATGDPTWAFLQVLYVVGTNYFIPINSSEVRRADPRHGGRRVGHRQARPVRRLADGRVTWTERAYLPKPTLRPVAMAVDDDNALECLALGIA